jgi:tetratricopeptide (TPR) repeat protein
VCSFGSNLAQLHQSLGQVAPTVQYLERHVALTTGVEYHEGMVYGLRNLAYVFQAIGRFEDAMACYTKLLALAEDLGHRDLYAKVLTSMANVEAKMAAGVKISPRDAAMALMVAAEESPHQPLSKRTLRGTLGKALRRKQKRRSVSDVYGNVRLDLYGVC